MTDPKNIPLTAEQMTALIQECIDRQSKQLAPGVIEAGVGRDQDVYAVIRDLMKELLIVADQNGCNIVELIHETLYMKRQYSSGQNMMPAIQALNPLVSWPFP